MRWASCRAVPSRARIWDNLGNHDLTHISHLVDNSKFKPNQLRPDGVNQRHLKVMFSRERQVQSSLKFAHKNVVQLSMSRSPSRNCYKNAVANELCMALGGLALVL